MEKTSSMANDDAHEASTRIAEEDDCEDLGSSAEDHYSDDSDDDPTYEVLHDTCSKLSNLSLRNSNSRVSKAIDSARRLELDEEKIEAPELDEKDKKCFEKVEEIVKAGGLERLTVDQCKVYLRKHGLRLSGKKEILSERIREHISIVDGRGEEKYPITSFVLNCKGDACTGDVVIFEQKVYEMYNVASRSATAPPTGTRMVAGRIVKESYGAAKQQHTFTIEVLWSKGMKPLPPLHPLLIKGRNLYRLNTMRQRWPDEEERNKVLLEKHSRGFVARSDREIRIKEKEMRKRLNGQRNARKENKQSSIDPGQSDAALGEAHQSNRQPLAVVKCAPNPIHLAATKEKEHHFSEQNVCGKLGKQQIPVRCSPPRRPLTGGHYHAQEYSSSSMPQRAANDMLDRRPLSRVTSPSKRPFSGGYTQTQQLHGHSSSPMRHHIDNGKLEWPPLSRVTSPFRRPFSGGHPRTQQLNGHSSSPMRHRADYERFDREPLSRFTSPSRRPFPAGYSHSQQQPYRYSSSQMHYGAADDKLNRFSSPSRRPYSGGYNHSQQPYGYSSSWGYADDKLDRRELSRFTSPHRRPFSGGSTQRQVCDHYALRRWCPYGDKCNNLHEYQENCGNARTGRHLTKELCRFNLQGRCHIGSSCKFVHER